MAEVILLFEACRNAVLLHTEVNGEDRNRLLWCRGKTLGITGYGNIGMQLGVIAESFGMKVVYFDVESKLP